MNKVGDSKSLKYRSPILSADDYGDTVSTINRKISLIESITTDKEFFQQLCNFYEFLTKDPILSGALNVIHASYLEESSVLDTLRKKIKSETDMAFQDLKKIALKNKLIDEANLLLIEEYYRDYKKYRNGEKKLTEEQANRINLPGSQILSKIREYYGHEAGAIQSLTSTPYESIMVGVVEAIVSAFKESGHTDLVQKYLELAKIPPSNDEYISSFHVSPTDEVFREKKKVIDRKLEPSAWYAFEMIKLVPLCVYDYPDYWDKLRADHNMAQMMNLGGYVGAMNTIMEGKKTEIKWFDREKYQLYLKRVVDAILDVLKDVRKTSEEAGPDFKKGQTVAFENDVIFFKLGDGTPDSIDLSNAPELLKVFKAFWELRKRKLGEELFTPETVITTYQKINDGESITRHHLATLISNLRQTKINTKPNLIERFILEFDNKTKSWHFKLS